MTHKNERVLSVAELARVESDGALSCGGRYLTGPLAPATRSARGGDADGLISTARIIPHLPEPARPTSRISP